MKIVKLKNGKYALRKYSLIHLGYLYADLDDMKEIQEIHWWSVKNNYVAADTLEEIEELIKNYKLPPQETVIKKVKFPKQ